MLGLKDRKWQQASDHVATLGESPLSKRGGTTAEGDVAFLRLRRHGHSMKSVLWPEAWGNGQLLTG